MFVLSDSVMRLSVSLLAVAGLAEGASVVSSVLAPVPQTGVLAPAPQTGVVARALQTGVVARALQTDVYKNSTFQPLTFPAITASNWGEVLSDVCWWYMKTARTVCLPSDEKTEIQRNEGCTLMDLMLSTRHFHPVAGHSAWRNSLEGKSVLEYMSVDLPPLSRTEPSEYAIVKNIQHSLAKFRQLPTHQQLGFAGLFSMLMLLVVCAIFVRVINKEAAHHLFREMFDFRNHFSSTLRINSVDKSADHFLFFDGIRVVSMFWIVLGHGVLYWASFLPVDEANELLHVMMTNPIYIPIFAAIMAVDNFFYLSGFLGGYHLFLLFHRLKNVPKREGKKPSGFFRFTAGIASKFRLCLRMLKACVGLVVTRYFRLIGTFAIILFSYLSLDWNTMNSAAGTRYLQTTNLGCVAAAPSLLLAVNNVAHGAFINECFGWSWYLSNDFQFFVVGLVVICAAVIFPKTFWWSIYSCVAATIFITYSTCSKYNLSMNIYSFSASWRSSGTHLGNDEYFPLHPVFDYYYVKPWVRIGPHVVGLAFGVILAQCRLTTQAKIDNKTDHKIHEQNEIDEQAKVDARNGVRTRPRHALVEQSTASSLSSPRTIISGESPKLTSNLKLSSNLMSNGPSSNSKREVKIQAAAVMPQRLVYRGLSSQSDTEATTTNTTEKHSPNDSEDSSDKSISSEPGFEVFAPEHLPDWLSCCVTMEWPPIVLLFLIPVMLVIIVFIETHIPAIRLPRWFCWLFMASNRVVWGVEIAVLSLLMLFPPALTPAKHPPTDNRTWTNRLQCRVVRAKQIVCRCAGGFVECMQRFLSHRYWRPFSRLSFTIYLCHPIVLFGTYGNGLCPEHFHGGYLSLSLLGNVVVSCLIAFAVTVFIDLPLRCFVTGFMRIASKKPKAKV